MRAAVFSLVLGTGPILILSAQSAGTFAATGSMNTARSAHTATVLANGKVLIAGGVNFFGSSPVVRHYLAGAELYDPSTGTFTPTGDMTMARAWHSAALLRDGRVLIVGGASSDYVAATSAELYDPTTGTFTATSGTTAVNGIATLLKNGNVLITGDIAQLCDPVTNSLAPAGSYSGPFPDGLSFFPSTATLLQDGRVLVAGTGDNSGAWLEHEEIYDPATGTFTLAGKVHTYGDSVIWGNYSATLLQDGKVLLAGGVSEDFGFFSAAELFDPSTNSFMATGNMTIARAAHTATLLPDGTVLIAGGFYLGLITAELYNPATGKFSPTGNMTIGRAFQSGALLFDGRVLVSGGVDDYENSTWLSSADLYTPRSPAPTPALFSLSSDGTGQGAIWHADTGKIASSANPAAAGDVLSMYTTSLFEGGAIPPQVAIGGQTAELLFFGDAPGYPGYYQVNFRVPNGVAPGPAVSVRLNYLGHPSNEVTIGVQ